MAAGQSKEFSDLIKAIGEAKSKQEEDRIIIHEVAELKKKMGDATIKGVSRSPPPPFHSVYP